MITLIISIIVSFFTTYVLTPYFIRFLYSAGIVGLDLHKKNKPLLPGSGGICVATGILAGLLTFIGIQTFIYGLQVSSISLLAVISTVLIVTFVGLLDDLNVTLRKTRTKEGLDIRVGLSQWIKPLLTLVAAIPLMVISAGITTMSIPFVGHINFGILYPLFLIPIAVVFASNAVNMLGGFNGLEAGMGIVYSLTLGIYGLINGSFASVIFLVVAAALAGFVRYNWFPAKILPGDSLTYLLGSTVAAGVIVGNMETVGAIALIPFFIEFFLKLKSRFKASCLGKLRSDGKLDPPYGKKIYSLTHVVMNINPFREYQVSLILIGLEVLIGLFIIFLYPLLI